MMKEQRLGILAIQESHLTDSTLLETQRRFDKSLAIANSPFPDNPSGSAGVGFILNKALIRTDDFTIYEILPGRAAVLRVNWNGRENLNILNVYAPNAPNLHPQFWADILANLIAQDLTHIDYMMGDTNLAEDARDRSPPHPDDENAVSALRDFRHELGLRDTWRESHPRTKAFTYRHNRGAIKSRLDRIYTSDQHASTAYEWGFTPRAMPSDHDLVSVKHAMSGSPEIGEGRWTLPLFLINDKSMIDEIETLGIALQKEIMGEFPNRENSNPQRLWYHFKWDIQTKARDIAARATCAPPNPS
ncbi:DNase I-like protein [Auriscalpium vulgare]|uniref:DNase I-like protein n=1 Tax=Auriscalpium vulgare TaxID=40419 RepID=A0ACB8S822_9AGAM|nr:DNase I-like protein [Auriscalpium vulgare]